RARRSVAVSALAPLTRRDLGSEPLTRAPEWAPAAQIGTRVEHHGRRGRRA
ncbi:MAG: hypothetical protein QOC57_1021, partial [Ilumatobacteraceae bacterium]